MYVAMSDQQAIANSQVRLYTLNAVPALVRLLDL